MSEIKYNFGGISQVADEINGHVRTFDGQKDELAANVNDLLSVWSSDASEAYQGSQRKFDQAYLELTQVLQQISVKVQTGSDTMQAANARAASSWG